MGNYIFRTGALLEELRRNAAAETTTHDFGKDILATAHKRMRVAAYDFATQLCPGESENSRGYWRDVGALDAYFDANMDLVSALPVFNLYNAEWPVYSHQPPLPPAKISEDASTGASRVSSSLLCQGSIVSGGSVERSVIGPEVFIEQKARISDSIVFPGVRVGAGARLRRCIVDKNVAIPAGVQIGFDPEEDASQFTVSDGGVVVIEKGRDLAMPRT
jgi:glucose-1-phosphate adenylyltransferase